VAAGVSRRRSAEEGAAAVGATQLAEGLQIATPTRQSRNPRSSPTAVSCGADDSPRRARCASPDRLEFLEGDEQPRLADPIPKGLIRFLRDVVRGDRAATQPCRSASMRGRARRRGPKDETSCGPQSASSARRQRSGLGLPRFVHSPLTRRCQCVQAAPRAILARGNLWIFPMALEQSHLLEPAQRAIERSVCRQLTLVADVFQPLGDLEAVKFPGSSTVKVRRAGTNRELEWEKRARLSSHSGIISRYMLMCPAATGWTMPQTDRGEVIFSNTPTMS
jgi:hypothetical protein